MIGSTTGCYTLAPWSGRHPTSRPSVPRSPRPTRRRATRSSSVAKLDDALVPEAGVRLPLATMNRHGLIAGATGTGKTQTLQVIAEQLSAAGVAVFTADVKGDLSGMAVPARATALRRSARRSSAFPTSRPATRSSTCRSVASARGFRCGRPSPTSGRFSLRRCSARMRRRSRASRWSSTTPTRRSSAPRPHRPARALTFLDSEADRKSCGESAASHRRPSVFFSARSSRSRPVAETNSSASRSSTSPTFCARTRTGEA